ncbi:MULTISPECIES: DHA2 family efflux MFS transporter permease subunit [unclassified Microbacterium]|uniref:DHA2 family efflux MFS transporter permease subunit n=1 Tax=unclassified Microbacterium TaxID=2609290 RepID=UPI00301748B8
MAALDRRPDPAVVPPSPVADAPAAVPSSGIGAKESRVIWLLLAAAFVAILNETTMGVAIPHLIGDLGITAVAAQWLTTAFMLTMAVVIPTTGFLLNRFSTRSMFATAMGLFSTGTLIALLAPGFTVLVIGRVVQASGTAIMMPLLMTTLMTVVPPHLRGRMMGRVSVVISLAPAIGPTMAGVVLDTLSWRWIFAIVLPIALIALAVGVRWIPNIGERTHAPFDVLSVVLSALGFGGLVFGLSQIGGHGGAEDAATSELATTTLVVSLTVGVVALGLFIWRQLILQKIDDALLDLRIFRSGNFSLSVAHFAVMSLAFFGTITALPLYLQGTLHMSATESGLVVLPGALAMGLLGPVIGRIYDRRGTRVLLIPGTLLVLAVLWGFTMLTESTPVWILVVTQTVLSIGLAMSFTPLFTASLGSLEPKYYSYGSATVSTVQQVAGAAGIALLITVMSSVTAAAAQSGVAESAAGAAGARAAFLLAAIIGTPLLVSAFLIRKPDDSGDGAPPVH